MKRVIAMTPPDAQYGFGLAGIAQQECCDGDIRPALANAMEDPQNGLIILDERLAVQAGEELLRDMDRRWQGVIVVLPKPGRVSEGDDYALRLIRRAIGYHVRLRI